MDIYRYRDLNREGRADFHTHTNYCDGNALPEEMLKAAVAGGLKAYGFSEHGYTPYDDSYCMTPNTMDKYEREIRTLAEEYASQVQVLCGIEQDCLAGKPDRKWDYIIGSVHYINCDLSVCDQSEYAYSSCTKGYIPIDETPEILLDATERYFGGDIYALVEQYYKTLSEVYDATDADIIGHFDLITKFNRGGELGGAAKGALFDENHHRYVAAWQKAADRLLKTGAVFEINTGAVSRGYREDFYPTRPIREYLKSRGAKFIYSSDSHNTDTICFKFGSC